MPARPTERYDWFPSGLNLARMYGAVLAGAVDCEKPIVGQVLPHRSKHLVQVAAASVGERQRCAVRRGPFSETPVGFNVGIRRIAQDQVWSALQVRQVACEDIAPASRPRHRGRGTSLMMAEVLGVLASAASNFAAGTRASICHRLD